jgi:hypothetical protein
MQVEKICSESEIIGKYENLLQMPSALHIFFEKSKIVALLLWLQTKQIIPDPELIERELQNALLKTNSSIHSQSFSNSFQNSVCTNVKERLIKFFQLTQ